MLPESPRSISLKITPPFNARFNNHTHTADPVDFLYLGVIGKNAWPSVWHARLKTTEKRASEIRPGYTNVNRPVGSNSFCLRIFWILILGVWNLGIFSKIFTFTIGRKFANPDTFFIIRITNPLSHTDSVEYFLHFVIFIWEILKFIKLSRLKYVC